MQKVYFNPFFRYDCSIFLFLHKDCRLFPNVDANGLACQFIRFFGYSYEKPELLYEYPGKLPDVYFNFSAFFPVGLPFRESVPTESCFRILNSFSPGSSSGSASRTIRFVLCMMQLSMMSLRVVTSKSISHTCSAALKKVAQCLETEVADGVETRMRADARDALDFRLRYVRQGAQCIDELS